MTRILTSNFQAPIEVISSFQYKVRRDFDSDVSLDNPVNVEAARQRDGFMILEEGLMLMKMAV